MKSEKYNPNDKEIWYNNKELKEKVLNIQNKFGEPFLITKEGIMLYEDCTVIPAFRNNDNYEE